MILYVDVAQPEPSAGLNPDFGLFINRPFYIVSQMESNRYMDIVKGYLVVKTRTNRETQVFTFDQKSRTIKS